MTKFIKKPIVIEAYQATRIEKIETLEGTMKASVGDWIITGIKGERHPCNPDIFEKTYEPLDFEFYNEYGCKYFSNFLKKNLEYNTPEFREYVIFKNRGDRDSGELDDIAPHEILRLASEYMKFTLRK